MKTLLIIVAVVVISTLWFFLRDTNETRIMDGHESSQTEMAFERFGLQTDTSKRSIALDQVFSGGPGKDGIPAISDPSFISIADASVDGETLGVLVTINDVKRFYPYTILVWHEIVNDSIGDTNFAVTFCPLCGSAIVFDRNVNGDILSFGVSGLLFESNLLMYDRETESLWSQAKTEAVAGSYTSTKLSVLPMKLLTFSTLQSEHPDAQVLSEDTGYARNYGIDPYTGYGLSESLYFPVSVSDKRFPAKEIFYVIPYKDQSIAFPEKALTDTDTLSLGGETLTATRNSDGITVTTEDETTLPGYYEMWFSWATHHQEDGVIWEID